MKTTKTKMMIATMVAVMFSVANGNAQSLQWSKFYSTGGLDEGHDIVLDSDTNSYVTGNANNDVAVVKYTPTGTQSWASTYNGAGSGADAGSAIAYRKFTNATNKKVYVAGNSDEGGTKGQEIFIQQYKVSSSTAEWTATWPATSSSGTDVGVGVVVDASKNVYVTGYGYNLVSSTSDNDIVVLKYDSLGTLQYTYKWNNTTPNSDDAPHHIMFDPTGANLYVCGETTVGTTTLTLDAVIIKLRASDLTAVWATPATTWNGAASADDIANRMALGESGYIYVCGQAYENSPDYMDGMLLKINESTGAVTWSSTYDYPVTGYTYVDYFNDISTDINSSNCDIYLVGNVEHGGWDDYDYLIVKYNQAGTVGWQNVYDGTATTSGGTSIDLGWGIKFVEKTFNSTRKVFVTGVSEETNEGQNITTLQYNYSTGAQEWSHSFNRNGYDDAQYKNDGEWYNNMIAVNNDNCHGYYNVFVTGASQNTSGGDFDMTTLKYRKTGPCSEAPEGEERYMTSGETENFNNMVLYPNPAKDQAKFRTWVAYENAVFAMYDVYGREVKRMEHLNSNEFQVDIAGLAEGLYLYKYYAGETVIKTGSFIISK